jgi:Tfp pilus assembly protein PilF
MQAFREASRIADPQKKIDALEKFIAKFSDSEYLTQANREILVVLVKNSPDQKEKILAQANKIVESAPVRIKDSAHNFVAQQLVEAKILLDKAEEFASRGLALQDESLRRSRATYLATLGQVYLEEKKTAEAKQTLTEAYAGDPSLVKVSTSLAKLEFEAGQYQAAVDYLVALTLKGKMTAESRQLLEAAYRKLRGGSLDGLETLLDKKYEETYPPTFKASAPRSNRIALAEVFTGAACPPCTAADLAFDAIMERYPRKDLAVLMYHQHIPRPDPMANPVSVARGEFYEIEGVPAFAIDGELSGDGGGRDRTMEIYGQIYPLIERRLETPADAELTVEASMQGMQVKVKVVVDKVKSKSGNLMLQIALAEDRLRYSGQNTIRFHPMVVRSLAGIDGGGFAVSLTQPTTAEHTFDLTKLSAELKAYLDDYEAKNPDENPFIEKKHLVDPGNLSVVTFVQDEASKQVLQAAYLKVKPAAPTSGSAR